MNCPLCVDEVLDVTHHQGIEIDVCPRCRGLWLDRGELDRLFGTEDEPPIDTTPRSGGGDSTSVVGAGLSDVDDRAGSGTEERRPRRRRLIDKLGDALEEVLDL